MVNTHTTEITNNTTTLTTLSDLVDTYGLSIETELGPPDKSWLSIYNNSYNLGEDDDENVGNIQFYHTWNKLVPGVSINGYVPTGEMVKMCHSRINSKTGRTDIYWHLGNTNLIPDSIDDFMKDGFQNGWYDVLEE